ncbi:MAG: molybdopterin-binding protein [Myxococcota bacterium]|nr:molybdopterin-binding protein [Myxococcota bacterium]
MPTAGLLIIGNEILSGKIVDTNSPFLATQLRELGVDLERILVIPDIVEVIAEETRRFSADYDYVFTSGGIGPTHDDVTMESIAKAFDQALRLDPQICARIERAQKEPLNDAMRKMALMPEGANVIDVSDLWFPVVVVENVHILPGIPQLFEKKFLSIRDRFAGVPIHLTRFFVTRHESDIAEDLNDLLREFSELMLGSYPKIGEPDYRVMLTLESRDSDYLKRASDSLRRRLASEIIFRVE